MSCIIRSMNPDEALELKRMAKKTFGLIDGIFVTKPKTALVAILDEKIVAGMYYYTEKCGDKKIGWGSFFFTDRPYQGQGIGKRLCEEVTKLLWAQGCDLLLTYVRDDNIASWGTFAKSGFIRADLMKTTHLIGLQKMLKIYASAFGLAISHELYIALPSNEETRLYEKK